MLKSDLHDLDADAFYLFSDDGDNDVDDAPHLSYCWWYAWNCATWLMWFCGCEDLEDTFDVFIFDILSNYDKLCE